MIDFYRHLIAGFGPLKIQLAGLDCMEKNRAKVNVLYANAKIVDDQNVNLQSIANSIVDYFYERGSNVFSISCHYLFLLNI